jgi:hypothetical protein
MEKAYRCANLIADRLQATHAAHPAPSLNTSDAVAELGALARWCDGVAPAK